MVGLSRSGQRLAGLGDLEGLFQPKWLVILRCHLPLTITHSKTVLGLTACRTTFLSTPLFQQNDFTDLKLFCIHTSFTCPLCAPLWKNLSNRSETLGSASHKTEVSDKNLAPPNSCRGICASAQGYTSTIVLLSCRFLVKAGHETSPFQKEQPWSHQPIEKTLNHHCRAYLQLLLHCSSVKLPLW